MISKTFTNAEIETLLQALRGPNGNDGLAFQKLPVRKVVFPLLRFTKDVKPIMEAFTEARQRLADLHQAAETDEEKEALTEELVELMAETHDIRLQPVCGQCLDDMDMSLAEIQILSHFFPEQDDSPDIQPSE